MVEDWKRRRIHMIRGNSCVIKTIAIVCFTFYPQRHPEAFRYLPGTSPPTGAPLSTIPSVVTCLLACCRQSNLRPGFLHHRPLARSHTAHHHRRPPTARPANGINTSGKLVATERCCCRRGRGGRQAGGANVTLSSPLSEQLLSLTEDQKS